MVLVAVREGVKLGVNVKVEVTVAVGVDEDVAVGIDKDVAVPVMIIETKFVPVGVGEPRNFAYWNEKTSITAIITVTSSIAHNNHITPLLPEMNLLF